MKSDHDRFFQMRITEDFISDLDALRKLQPDLPARAEMIRRLVQYGLRKKLALHEDLIRK